jgi:SAM-dependent methyltransferase
LNERREASLKQKLVEFLVCPECKGELALQILDQLDEEIITGSLDCATCHKGYPIVSGVPRFAPHQQEQTVMNTVEGFGYQWQTFNEVARAGQMGSPELFLDFIQPVTPEHFRQKLVLDIGCGVGRFCKTAADFGPAHVIGVDLSDSVDVAYQNLKQFPNIHIVQADIFKLPLKPVFDYIFSIGVLHHTIDPRKSFRAIIQLLKSNGSVSVWVYSRENNGWVIHIVNPIRLHITSRLPRNFLYLLSLPIGAFLYLILNSIYKPINSYPGLFWACKWLFYNEYLFFLSKFSFQEQLNVVYDHLVPGLAFYISRKELESWFEENHLENTTISMRSGNGWRGFGLKKA